MSLSNECVSVLVAGALFPALVATHVLLFRRNPAAGLKLLLAAFGLYALYWLLLMGALRGVPTCMAAVSGIATVGFFCLGYMQIFSLACRGFSLRIIAEIGKRGNLTRDEIFDSYAEGRGLDWMYEKRLADLEHWRLVRRAPDRVRCTALGRGLGTMVLLTKKFIHIGSGG